MRTAAATVGLRVCGALALGTRIATAVALDPLPVYQHVSGEEVVHAVAPGETLGHIARRFGVKLQLATIMNKLSDPHRLRLGQRLRLSNRRIVPSNSPDGITINVADLTLYWVREGVVMAAFPVGVGRSTWETPPGHYTIVGRRRDPIWHVPRSIQMEMKEKGEPVKKKVPAGADNPLGKYWLQLSASGYGIHGTNAPWTVGKYTTHGCVRLRPDDIEWLFNRVPNDTTVDIIDEPIKVARLEGDTVVLEAHMSSVRHQEDINAIVEERLQPSGIADLVDLDAATQVLRNAWGVAIDVSKKNPARLAQSR